MVARRRKNALLTAGRGCVVFSLILMMVIVEGCTHNDSDYARQTRQLKSADVVQEVDSALKRGDKRFVGVMGFGLIVPGVKKYHTSYAKTHGVCVIENTSDAIENDEHMTLQEVAAQYALKYNTELLGRLAKE